MAADDTEPATTAGDDPEGLGYAEAVTELEEILAQLDGDEIDVDHLATQVRRAASLIALCRERLGAARVEVTRIVADLDLAAPTVVDDGELALDDADDADGDPEDDDG
ncbi:exodeoxyribonuclease VII small subunit [Rhabdothermincola salaria]|uniref:exodeoxyribonuclease VII small subunit n=1 Tax=Rhabdothermincola salaria TaxID=2903142 RepID=UPI001E3EF55D|nr:exodeoxyribonuclease VII small subunit [Rhabdothermincola salaria]MCD9625448.1 exodeoxyribonuclease VII small subunit [Rhabdothermincola salaria]